MCAIISFLNFCLGQGRLDMLLLWFLLLVNYFQDVNVNHRLPGNCHSLSATIFEKSEYCILFFLCKILPYVVKSCRTHFHSHSLHVYGQGDLLAWSINWRAQLFYFLLQKSLRKHRIYKQKHRNMSVYTELMKVTKILSVSWIWSYLWTGQPVSGLIYENST